MVLKKKSIGFIFMWILILIVLFPKLQVLAQDDYPNRPIELIIPWAPGGPTDLGCRFFTDKWAEFLGQPVVPVNKAGGIGTIGTRYAVLAKPDGYTLLSTSDSTLITAPLERKDIGYSFDNFRYPVTYGHIVLFFSVKFDSRWKTMNDFLKEAKDNPGKLKYATMGPKHPGSLAIDLLCRLSGAKLTLVPFKSTPDCLTGLVGGNVDLAVTNGLAGFRGTGMVRTLAVESEKRLIDFPTVPTLKESGYPIELTPNITGLATPLKTSERILEKIIGAHKKVCTKYLREIEEKLPSLGVYPIDMDEKAVLEFYREKRKLYKEYYDRIGVKPE